MRRSARPGEDGGGATEAIERLPVTLRTMARELRAGATLQEAVRTVADDGPASGFRTVVARIDAGAGVAEAIDRWAADLGHRDTDLVRAVLSTGAAAGGALAASLDRAAASLEERVELQREIRALSSQARTSAMVLTVSPLAFLAMMGVADSSVVEVVAYTGIGRACIGVGLVLDLAGWRWMRHLAGEAAR